MVIDESYKRLRDALVRDHEEAIRYALECSRTGNYPRMIGLREMLTKENAMTQENKKYPLTVFGSPTCCGPVILNHALDKEFWVCTECKKEVSPVVYPQPLEILEVPTDWGMQLEFNFNNKETYD